MTDTLRDRIAAALRERVACGHHETYEDVERKQIRNCRDQIVADVKDWLAIE